MTPATYEERVRRDRLEDLERLLERAESAAARDLTTELREAIDDAEHAASRLRNVLQQLADQSARSPSASELLRRARLLIQDL